MIIVQIGYRTPVREPDQINGSYEFETREQAREYAEDYVNRYNRHIPHYLRLVEIDHNFWSGGRLDKPWFVRIV